jgi:protein-S-isoprenylcysteine O-methyltransferase
VTIEAATPPRRGGVAAGLSAGLFAATAHAALLLSARLVPGASPGRLADPGVVAFALLWLAWSAGEAALTPVDGGGRGAAPSAVASRVASRMDGSLGLATGLALLGGAWHGLWAGPGVALSPGWAAGAAVVSSLALAAGVALRLEAVRVLGGRFVTAARVEAGAALVTAGPFACVRHPSEAGLLGASLAAAILLRSPVQLALWAGVLLPVSLTRARREDRVLAAAYGPVFEDYRRRTGSLWPRLRARSPSTAP